MMAAWETEDELSAAAAAGLPAPTDTPYRTPSRTSRRSRSSRRSITPPGLNSSPPRIHTEKHDRASKRFSRDISDDNISPLDPRRFTPTLHANLVSEILALRRDQEEKLKVIEALEESLQSTREEQESAKTNFLDTAKENRSLKQQLTLLEGGTSTAIGELARERDEAVDAISDTRKRLETTQNKVRKQEEDSQRVHDLWAKEKDEWEEERRKYEVKLHIADTRLKTVLDEVAQIQATQLKDSQNGTQSDAEDGAKDNDAASVRTMSMTNSIRYSIVPKASGHSLAEELNFDDDDYETDADGRQSVMSTREQDGRQSVMSNKVHMRNYSRDSVSTRSTPKTHRRNMSSESQVRPGSVARGRFYMNQTVLERLEGGIREDEEDLPAPKPVYRDTGVQFSPPASPKHVPVKPATPEPFRVERLVEMESPLRGDSEIEANQRRKRISLPKPAPLPIEPTKVSKSMVSSASQTFENLSSPPRSPIRAVKEVVKKAEVESAPPPAPPMLSTATQTDALRASSPVQRAALVKELIPIPSISIHPPTTRPSSPQEPRLPQYVKDFGCQVSILQPIPTKSSSTQTEEIMTDKRLDKLPAHLHPSAIRSRPASPNVAATSDEKEPAVVPSTVPPRNPRRLTSKRSVRSLVNESPSSPPASPGIGTAVVHDAYPGNNDNGPLSNQKAPASRPSRLSSLFAGFDAQTSDEVDEFAADADLSDGEYRTPLTAPKPPSSAGRHHRRRPSGGTSSTTTETARAIIRDPPSSAKQIGVTEVYSTFALDGRATTPRTSKFNTAASRAGAMRKSALIQSGIASHNARAASPALLDSRDPPFPIPKRASSRNPPISISNTSDGRRSPTRRDSWHRRGMRGGPYRSNSIRKSHSASAYPRHGKHRRRQSSRSPPPMTPSTEAPESPGLPPLPTNAVTSPKYRDLTPRYRVHRSHPSTNTTITDVTNTPSVAPSAAGSQQQGSGVVDAIAQTMVGEWMYKYVRRRKSFGVADAKSEENSNDRHKRWVWLAPYERAILWSSKQPSSGSALMGKSGRKLTIQSVLDVKDDNPPPKGVTQLFNRSILILTPQRALKFTATSAERHYLWLTSLSFLAHSAQAVPDLLSPTAAPAPAPDFELPPPPPPKLKKGGIRDSIRLTKGKRPALANSKTTGNLGQLEEALEFRPENFASMPNHDRDLSRDIAEPPHIPRYQERVQDRANQVVLHGRKRSNTGDFRTHIPPPLSFRGLGGPNGPTTGGTTGPTTGPSSYHTPSDSTAGNSVGTAESSDIYSAQGSSTGNTTWGAGSVRTSEASSRPSNFFEAIGTVRMEAFISPLAFPKFSESPNENDELQFRVRRRSKERRRRRSRSGHRDSYNSRTTRATDDYYAASTRSGEDYFREDPFKGF